MDLKLETRTTLAALAEGYKETSVENMTKLVEAIHSLCGYIIVERKRLSIPYELTTHLMELKSASKNITINLSSEHKNKLEQMYKAVDEKLSQNSISKMLSDLIKSKVDDLEETESMN